jgi:glutamate-1-semialdehyde 2,1-aminomutase
MGEVLDVSSASRAIFDAACGVIPGGVNSATRAVGAPYAFTRAQGARMWDADGREYLDYHAAFGAILLGHCDPRVDGPVRETIGQIDLTGYGVTELEVEYARLVAASIESIDTSLATSTGTEATLQAVRLARAITGRRFIVKFQGNFHGWHDAVARNVISPPERAYQLDPLSAGILPDAFAATLIAEYNDLASVQELFTQYPEQIAGVIFEAIPHNVGALLPTQEFVDGLRALTSREGALLICDEVITGFRHGLGGYQQVLGLDPDLTTFGKGIANGYPVAGIGGRRELMERFSSAGGDVVVAGTFNGHAIGMAAAIATISQLRDDPEIHLHTHALGDRMRDGLRSIVGGLGFAGTVAGFGSVFCLYFCEEPIRGYRDLMRNDDAAYLAFHRRMTDRGILMLPLTLKRNHISAAHTAEDIDRTLEVAEQVLREMSEQGLLG